VAGNCISGAICILCSQQLCVRGWEVEISKPF
jgi:hypothetical protein